MTGRESLRAALRKEREKRIDKLVKESMRVGVVVVYEAAMGIDWMRVRELVQAVPPAYTEWVGRELLSHVPLRAAA